jgi:uncharacterized protein
MLTDTGPLIALIDREDKHHASCIEVLSRLTRPMQTTWPVFTEAMVILGEAGGWSYQEKLWEFVRRGALELVPLDETAVSRTADVMKKYKDRPMDLADATLVALAEARSDNRILTLNSDFQFFRNKNNRTFGIVP